MARSSLLETLTKPVDRPNFLIDRDSIYCSRASLEDVDNVRCFYEACPEEQTTQLCIRILIEYTDRRQAALGQCRIGASYDVQVMGPTAMYIKKAYHGSNLTGVNVQFTSDLLSEEFDRSGWERSEMIGELIWWFEHGIVKIIHSL